MTSNIDEYQDKELDKTDELAKAFREIFFNAQHGSVEGVAFDFRRSGISFDDWFSTNISTWHMPEVYWGEPYIEFPWRNSVAFPKRRGVKKYVVKAGDEIRVANVEIVQTGFLFDHKSDQEMREVYIEIKRKSGKVIQIEEPLLFYRHGSLLPRGMWGRLSFEKIATRICQANNVETIFDLCYCWDRVVSGSTGEPLEFLTDLETMEEILLSRAHRLSVLIHATLCAIGKREFKVFEFAQTTPYDFSERYKESPIDDFDVEQAFDSAIALGYLWAQYEADQSMRPLAQSGIASKQGASIGGKKSGYTRKQKAANTWQPHARELAGVARKLDPKSSQEKVAGEIWANWKLPNPDAPSIATLKRYVAQLEKEGKLAPRQ